MNIKRVKTRRFAGLKEVDLGFVSGLNIVLGPNEAGKSTLVEAMRVGLLAPVGLKGKEKKDFEERYLPLYGGDAIDVELEIGTSRGDLRLLKTFGYRPSAQLETGQGGALITRELAVYQQLNIIFGCGEKTIDTLVFARQRDFQNLFAQVAAQDLAQGLSTVLHQAVLELDGISVRRLEQRINDEIESLLGRWDLEKGRPEGGRGLERPYIKGVGRILASYYHREQIGQRMKQCLDTEQKMTTQAAQIKSTLTALQGKQTEIKTLAALEDDMIKRLEIEPRVQTLAAQMEIIKKDIQEWPVAEHMLNRNKERLTEVVTRSSLVKLEEENSRAREGRKALRELLDSVENCLHQEQVFLDEADTLKLITESQYTELENMTRRMEDLKISLQAARMQSRIKLAPGVTAAVTCDFDEAYSIKDIQLCEAGGYLRVEIDGVAVVEVQSGESDYAGLKQEYEECRTRLGGLLLKLGIDNMDDARYAYRRMGIINREIDGLRVMVAALLGSRTLESIQEELAAKENLPPARPLPEIKQEQEALAAEEGRLRQEIARLRTSMGQWQQVYDNRDGAAEKLLSVGQQFKALSGELDLLSPLPPVFTSPAEFRTYLEDCREEEKQITHTCRELQDVYREFEASLGGDGYEDLRRLYEEIDEQHHQLIEQVKVLKRVQTAFAETEKEIKQLAEKPLIEHFAEQVMELTGGRYGVVGEPGFLEFSLLHHEDYNMPLHMLSAGTLDLVALAFRFALLYKLFPEGGGMVVLDDCLVDLDPERRQRAVNMINNWAQQNQVIFVTCDPVTAEQLGGQIVNL